MTKFVIERTDTERWYWAGKKWSRVFDDAIIVQKERAEEIIKKAKRGPAYAMVPLDGFPYTPNSWQNNP